MPDETPTIHLPGGTCRAPECHAPIPLVAEGLYLMVVRTPTQTFRLEFCSARCRERGRKRLETMLNRAGADWKRHVRKLTAPEAS